MKKLFFILLITVTTIFGACLGDEEADILNLGGGSGVDTVQIYNNNAFVSLDFNSWASNIQGFAKIDISDVSKFVKYDSDTYESYEEYLNAISNTTKVYEYAKDFIFDKNTSIHMRLTHVNGDNNGIYIYGYANSDDNASYIFKITLNNSVNVSFKKFENAIIKNYTSTNNEDYYIMEKNNNYFILKAFYAHENAEYTQPLTIQTFEKTDNSEVSLAIEPGYLYLKLNDKLYRVDLSINSADDVTNEFPQNIGKLLAVKCNYLFYSHNDTLVMFNMENNQSNSVKVWDPAQIKIVGNTLFVANYGAMINAVNISDPNNIYVEANTSEWALNDYVTYYNGKIYVGGGWRGLAVYDAQSCDIIASTFCGNENNESNENNQNNQNNETNQTDNNDECCFNANDVNILPTGWSIAGSGCEINDMSIFNSVKIVWIFRNGKWYAYTNDTNIQNILIQYGYETIQQIHKKEGFWIYK